MQNAMRRPSKREPSFLIAVVLATALLVGAIAVAPAISGAKKKHKKVTGVAKLQQQIAALTSRVDALERKPAPRLTATVVSQTPTTGAGSDTESVNLQCPAGQVASGGGGGIAPIAHVGDNLITSFPQAAGAGITNPALNGESPTGWFTKAHNGGGVGESAAYSVVCLGISP